MSEKFQAKGTSNRETEELRHESYGMVGFSRCSGGSARLFGSSMRSHNQFIRLSIKRGVRRHDLSRDWYASDGRLGIVEVDLSPAQFAELLTTMNVSDGVPCTIRMRDGKRLEDPPEEDTEVDKVRTGFRDNLKGFVGQLKGFRGKMAEILEKKSVGKADRAELLKQMDLFLQHVRENLPYVLDSFDESTEKVVTAAKAEVEAFTMHALVTSGLEAIAEGRVAKALQAPETDYARTPDGHINNCSIANGMEEEGCRMCDGRCPDRERFERGEMEYAGIPKRLPRAHDDDDDIPF